MSDVLLFENIAAWVVQATVIIAIAAALAWAFQTWHSAKSYLAYLQLLLVICILLPALQPWKQPTTRIVTRIALPRSEPHLPATTPALSFDWTSYAASAVLAGSSLRLIWLAIGVWRLRRLRAKASPLGDNPSSLESAKESTDASAQFLVSEEVSGPVTFGWPNPCVLVTPEFIRLTEAQQRAIACHELIHVRRRDWLVCLVEECALALLWFQPAVWWLVRQIRLTRERVVDAEAIQLCGSRDSYIDALLATARQRWQLDLAPAPLFLSTRHLKTRIEHLLKEHTMSKRKLSLYYASMASVIGVCAWIITTSLPLTASPQFEPVKPAAGSSPVLASIDTNSLGEPANRDFAQRLSKYVGRSFSNELMQEIVTVVSGVDRTLTIRWAIRPLDKNITLTLLKDPVPMEAQPQPDFGPSEEKRIRLGAGAAAAKLKYAPQPEYPALAKLARKEGTVKMAILIGKDGHVKQVYGLRGDHEFQVAAEAALINWVYGTTLLNGLPIEVATTVDVDFRLPE